MSYLTNAFILKFGILFILKEWILRIWQNNSCICYGLNLLSQLVCSLLPDTRKAFISIYCCVVGGTGFRWEQSCLCMCEIRSENYKKLVYQEQDRYIMFFIRWWVTTCAVHFYTHWWRVMKNRVMLYNNGLSYSNRASIRSWTNVMQYIYI